jgi:hypothetical protein
MMMISGGAVVVGMEEQNFNDKSSSIVRKGRKHKKSKEEQN